MAIRIMAIGIARGYSQHDHRITGREGEGLVGDERPTKAECLKVVEKAVEEDFDGPKLDMGPVELEVMDARGQLWGWYAASAGWIKIEYQQLAS